MALDLGCGAGSLSYAAASCCIVGVDLRAPPAIPHPPHGVTTPAQCLLRSDYRQPHRAQVLNWGPSRFLRTTLLAWNALARAADRRLGTRWSTYGWLFHFSRQVGREVSEDPAQRLYPLRQQPRCGLAARPGARAGQGLAPLRLPHLRHFEPILPEVTSLLRLAASLAGRSLLRPFDSLATRHIK